MRTFSFGGGRQSMAVLVLAAQNKLQYDAFLFSNVGEDSENPQTIKYFNEIAKPFSEKHNLNLIELHRIPVKGRNKGKIETLYSNLIYDKRRTIEIPVRMSNGATGKRSCTYEFKIKVVAKWQKKNGATLNNPAITGLGISLDEIHRARTKSYVDFQILEYPLLDLKLTANDCIEIIKESGLPVPPKSSCWFCPFHSRKEWSDMLINQPDLFRKAVELEKTLNLRRQQLNKDPIFFNNKAIPLQDAVEAQLDIFETDDRTCDTGHCFV